MDNENRLIDVEDSDLNAQKRMNNKEEGQLLMGKLASQAECLYSKEKLQEGEIINFVTGKLENIKESGTAVVSIIGGAGSGKTTFAHKLCEALGSADTIGTDDYVVGDRGYRRANLEGKDPILKYDKDFLNKKIGEILNLNDGEEVAVPTYNEKTGLAIAAGEENYTHKVGKVDYLIVEGDFDFAENPDYKIYFDVSDETRLDNRISRDSQSRSETDSQKIIDSFNLRHELQHIPHTLPAKDTADMVIRVEPSYSDGICTYEYYIEEN